MIYVRVPVASAGVLALAARGGRITSRGVPSPGYVPERNTVKRASPMTRDAEP